MLKHFKLAVLAVLVVFTVQAQSPIVAEEVVYTDPVDQTKLHGFVAYPAQAKKSLPAVIVIHEWWGSNDYARMRARKLAELGYLAFALDMYGEGKQGNDPGAAGALATPFYKNPALAQQRIEAAVAQVKTYPQANPKKMAAIGYCFGGSMVLNAAKLGMDFKSVVSFHGGLAGVPAEAGKTKAKILVCHGEADSFISADELNGFRKNLDDTKTSYQFIGYPGATHAFSNPKATEMGQKFSIPIAYQAEADAKSWNDMKKFLRKTLR